ncbi:MAG: histidine kinase dimerization/phosphoacceptor domain -containing protein [Bacteroidota bacterium]
MKTLLIALFFISFWSLLCAQSLDHLPVDSLLNWVSEHAYEIHEKEDAAAVHHYAYLTLLKAQVENKPSTLAKAAQNLALVHYVIEDQSVPDSSLFYDQMALDYLLQTDNKPAIAAAYKYIGGDYQTSDDYGSAQESYLSALKIYEELDDQPGAAEVYADLSFLYAKTKDFERAKQYGEKGIATLRTMGIPDTIAFAINFFYLVPSYIGLGEITEAINTADESVNFLQPYSADAPFALVKAYAWRAEAQKAAKNYEKALVDYRYAWNFGKSQVADEASMGGYQEGIAEVLRLQGNYAEAIPYYENYLATMVMRDAEEDLSLAETHLELADCYVQTGVFEQAVTQYQIAGQLKDSLAEARYQSLTSELIQKYESDQKDAQIALQTATIRQQRQIQWLSVGLAALFALLLFGLFLTYRRNQKTNQLLQGLNLDLSQKNQQNELLLKEIHHRVKNNLQTISSLLSLQSAHIEDPKVQGAVEQSQNRVRSMALIHQKIYQGENLAAVEMKDYLQMLGETIVDTFGVDSDKVEIEYPMQEIELDVDTAIPLGLIANELLTNALKYAFPDERKGKIKVSLERVGEKFRFLVTDNGIGWKDTISPPKSGFGSQLIHLLTMQLGGQVKIKSEDGVRTAIEFSL